MAAYRRTSASPLHTLWKRAANPAPVVIDVGSVRTRVLVGGSLAFDQSSCIALHQNGSAVAYGDQAYSLVGNRSQFLQIVFPVQRGGVADVRALVAWLRYVRQQLWPNRKWLPFSPMPGGRFTQDATLGEADHKLWREMWSEVGSFGLEPMASVTQLPLIANVRSSELFWTLTAGGDHSVLALIQDETVLASSETSWGGIAITEAIQQWLSAVHHCNVSWHTAEQLKCEHAQLIPNKATTKFTVRGKSPITQLGVTVTIAGDELLQVVAVACEPLILTIKQFLAGLPSDQATKAVENGLWLVGGTAQLTGIEYWLANTLGMSVTVIANPATALLYSGQAQQ